MKPKSLLERFLYKYEYLGQVEKSGQVYKKFKKLRRFKFVKKGLKTVFFISLFVAVIFLIEALRNVMGGKFLRH